MKQLILKSILLIFLFHSLAVFAERGAAVPDYTADEITKGVYVIHGPLGVPSVENQGFINNPAFIVGEQGILVVDPGSSVQIGEMVLRQIAKVSDLPVVAVFNTHIHGDHWFANQAFREAYPEVLIFGHETMRKLVEKGEGRSFMQTLMRMTDGAVKGTVEVPPNRSAAHGEEIKLAGVNIRIHYQPKAHSHSDIMLELPQQKVIFLGDNVMSKRLGQMDSATFRGNIEAIDMALATSAERFVPGHGQTGGREVPLRYREYLSRLKSEVAKYYEEGMSDFEMSEAVSQSLIGFHDWVDFDRNVGRHISLAYLEVEAELF
ncbi:MAG: MBL fold metallo-hydrolase [Candidatus Thiodiazotropha lotti]|uniref:MBL fold metallo-hydrolase n=1 Tax=Candidatus Thiodiazotropha endoloripes TaxID=1818881 RepID=UPI0009F4CE1C|nr:MBL fold metallo-hydrolase [Candidatus Thiodiazotropha endoloripes]MCG7896932.1 MBL fold metallo-hydrolase [Candidatus Thiodiazotropha weberae]MCG7992638.1 MBL fold metallo-hydrolase [Candidatus Thiodiazotropha lotti]MCG7900992.1 MBL fold metallo-hydrolase [Candidatus Thiodiazotropha weberae]MCG7914276.1 MBL fold metallo-hydrolase [Candidatus Thiodiazotropha weberae]MCG8000080.1 MBL fold metallo-hydrolase [Candidatus Thiodiazotropha lotti]